MPDDFDQPSQRDPFADTAIPMSVAVDTTSAIPEDPAPVATAKRVVASASAATQRAVGPVKSTVVQSTSGISKSAWYFGAAVGAVLLAAYARRR